MRRLLLAAATALLATATPALAATLVAQVDISDQVLTVVYKGEVLAEWPVSTGREGFPTPTGEFRPQRMHREWFSTQYDYAPMPNAIFYDMGYAIHGTYETARLGAPASHGCVRLSRENAEMLFDLVLTVGPENTAISVSR